MINLLQKFLLAPIIVLTLLLPLLIVRPAAAAIDCGNLNGIDQSKCQACVGSGGVSYSTKAGCQNAGTKTLPDIIKSVVNILLFIVGAVSVIMLIIGGFRYVVSGGDSAGVEGAKNTILYAIIGVVVAFLSYAAVNFVISKLIKP